MILDAAETVLGFSVSIGNLRQPQEK